jgi:hypothetical protein
MIQLIIRFFNILLSGLVAGILLGAWLGYNPKNFSVQTYIEQQQGVINALNVLMPVLGLLTIILTITAAMFQKKNKTIFITLLIAAVFMITSGLVTRFGNQPINSIVMTWSTESFPDNWRELRDRWWNFHMIRTLTAFISFCLIISASMRKVEVN